MSPEDTATQHKLIEERVMVLQEQVTALQEEIRALRHSQNALLPVCRLPVELLAEVFLCVRDREATRIYRSAKRWIASTQVCKYWRDVALDCPTLWSNIDLASLDLAKLMVARSRGSPLDIELDLANTHPEEHSLLREVLTSEVVSRLQSIRVWTRGDALDGGPAFELWANRRFKAPLLKEFYVIAPLQNVDIGSICNKDTPALRHLHLRIQSIDWTGIYVGKNLTYLDLCQDPDSRRPSATSMHSVLEQATNLQKLFLSSCLPAPSNSKPAHLSLGQVQVLVLEDEEGNLRQFLKMVHFPRVRTATMTCVRDNILARQMEFDDTRSILFAVLESLPNGALIPQSFRKPQSIEIRDYLEDRLAAEFSFHEVKPRYLSLSISPWTPATVNHLTRSITNHMDCSNVDMLTVGLCEVPMPVESWRILSRLPRIQKLTIDMAHENVLPLMKFLKCNAWSENATNPTETCAFPVLSTLVLNNLQLLDDIGGRAAARAIIEALVDVFGSERRPPLGKLTIEDSTGFSSSDERQLRRELSKTEIAWIDNEEFTEDEFESDLD